MAMTSPIKIAAVHNRPQLQTISHPGGHGSHQDVDESMQGQNERITSSSNNNNTNYKGLVASGGANTRKMPSGAITEATANSSSHDYSRSGAQKTSQGHPGGHQAQLMGLSGGFGQPGVHHMRYQSQLAQQTKNDIQNRMNMTITHGYTNTHHTIQGVGSHGPPQYPKNQMIGPHGGN